jgi:hypothetical protein
MGSGEMIASLKHRLNAFEDTVCIQTCKPGVPWAKPVARFMNREAEQLRFYSAKVPFASKVRLTGFRGARTIVRIRTKCPRRRMTRNLDAGRLRRHACLQRSTV